MLTPNSSEKHELTEEAEKLITTIKQMHIGLDGKDAAYQLEEELQVTYPLKPCLQALKERHKSVNKAHRERYEQVKSKRLRETSRIYLANIMTELVASARRPGQRSILVTECVQHHGIACEPFLSLTY